MGLLHDPYTLPRGESMQNRNKDRQTQGEARIYIEMTRKLFLPKYAGHTFLGNQGKDKKLDIF